MTAPRGLDARAVDARAVDARAVDARAVDARAVVEALYRRAGISSDSVAPELTERMSLLASRTATLEDGAQALALAQLIFQYCSDRGAPFDATERTTVLVGTIFSDIGKTGPANATVEEQRLIADVFAVERVPNDQVTVGAFLDTYFPGDAGERRARLAGMGLDPAMSIRALWDKHSSWTLDLLQGDGVPPEAVAAAASHHLLEEMNPRGIVGRDGNFTRPFGTNAAFDRPEKLIIVLDKYDALRRRGRLAHAPAVAAVRALVAKSTRFKDDPEFQSLLEALDVVVTTRQGGGCYG